MTDTVIVKDNLQNIRQYYFSQRGEQLAIFNGVQREEYSMDFKGHAYFQSTDWQLGMVEYEHVLYDSIQMRYDLYTDQVVVKLKGSGGISFALFSPRVSQFSFSGLDFEWITAKADDPLVSGFYLRLVKGNLTAYEQRTKKIRERIVNGASVQVFEESIHYYLYRNGTYYPIEKKRNILTALKEHKKEIQQFISKNKLNFHKQPSKTLSAVAEFYNQSRF